jgi:uncharacterized membrane protein (DUF485 family)
MEHDATDVPRSEARPQCSRLGAVLGVIVAAAYYGFLTAGAVIPKQMARAAVGGVPWSFVLGAALLIFIVCATGIYALAANALEERP